MVDVANQAPDFMDPQTQAWLTAHDTMLRTMANKTYVITGASKGLGRAIAYLCARYGARLVLLSRDVAASEALIRVVNNDYPGQSHQAMALDLTAMSSIMSVSEVLLRQKLDIDGVFANAGIAADADARTKEGYSLTFSLNHIGHYALIGRLMPLLNHQQGSRVVLQSSIRHMSVCRDQDFSRYFNPETKLFPNAYADSKFANIAYARYLDQVCVARKLPMRAVCAHPGYVLTNINKNAHDATNKALINSVVQGLWSRLVLQGIQRLGLAQPSLYAGALPSLSAMLTSNPVMYTGPDGFLGLCGLPVATKPHSATENAETVGELWQKTEAFTQVRYFT